MFAWRRRCSRSRRIPVERGIHGGFTAKGLTRAGAAGRQRTERRRHRRRRRRGLGDGGRLGVRQQLVDLDLEPRDGGELWVAPRVRRGAWRGPRRVAAERVSEGVPEVELGDLRRCAHGLRDGALDQLLGHLVEALEAIDALRELGVRQGDLAQVGAAALEGKPRLLSHGVERACSLQVKESARLGRAQRRPRVGSGAAHSSWARPDAKYTGEGGGRARALPRLRYQHAGAPKLLVCPLADAEQASRKSFSLSGTVPASLHCSR